MNICDDIKIESNNSNDHNSLSHSTVKASLEVHFPTKAFFVPKLILPLPAETKGCSAGA